MAHQSEQQVVDQQQMQEQELAFFKALLSKTESISTTLYQKSPMKSQKLVDNAKIIDQQLARLFGTLDENLNKGYQVFNVKKQSIKNQYHTIGGSIQEKIQTSALVKKSNEYQNLFLNSMEGQLNHLAVLLLKNQELNNNSVNNQEQQIDERYRLLIQNATNLFAQAFKIYSIAFLQTPVGQKIVQVNIVREVAYDTLVQIVFNPLKEKFLLPTQTKALAWKQNSVELYQKYNQSAKQQYEQVKKFAIEQYQQRNILVTFQIVKQEGLKISKEQYAKLLQQYKSLQATAIQYYNDYFTIAFTQQQFLQNKTKILEAVKALRESLKQSPQYVQEKRTAVVNESKNIYQNARKEYQRRLEESRQQAKQLLEIQEQKPEEQQQQEN